MPAFQKAMRERSVQPAAVLAAAYRFLHKRVTLVTFSTVQIVVFNKMDLPESQEVWPAFQEAMRERGVEPVAISAVAQENTTAVLRQTQGLLKIISNPYEFDPFDQPGKSSVLLEGRQHEILRRSLG
jgi:50S ribosomal subunit-associated GTPase HflX